MVKKKLYACLQKGLKETYVVPQSEQTNWLPTTVCDTSVTDDDVINAVYSAPSAGGLGDGVGRDGEAADKPGEGRGPLR